MVPDFDRIQSEHIDYSQRQEDSQFLEWKRSKREEARGDRHVWQRQRKEEGKGDRNG